MIPTTILDTGLPGATFANVASYVEFADERRQYEAAVRAYAQETKPAAIKAAIAAARRRGVRLTKAEIRESAIWALRESLFAVPGYTEADVEWHAARRGRRDRHSFVSFASRVD